MSKEEAQLTVRDVMRAAPFTCSREDPLDHVLTMMKTHDLDVLCVVDEHQRLLSLLTLRDAAFEALARRALFQELVVSEVVRNEQRVPTCNPDDSVGHAERLMRLHRSPAVAVLDEGGRLLGLLQLVDLARASTETHAPGPEASEVVTTLAAVRGTVS